MTNAQQLTEATANRDAARIAFDSARHGSKAWRDAADDYDFWAGKVTMLELMVEKGI